MASQLVLLLLTQLSLASGASVAASTSLERLGALLVASPTGNGSRLTGMATELQQLATKIINGKESLTELHKDIFNSLREDMQGIQSTIAADHHEDQGEVDRALQAIKGCAPNQTELDHAAKRTSDAESAHEECRWQEIKLASARKGTCRGPSMFQDMEVSCMKAPPEDGSPEDLQGYLDVLREQIEKAVKWNATISSLSAACENAKQQHDEKIAECNVSQAHFEMNFCAYRQALVFGCAAYDACRTEYIAKQHEIHEAVRVTEAGRKAEFKTASQIICLVHVFEVSPKEQPAEYQACTGLSVDTSDLNIVYHDVPPADHCDTTPVEQYPCLGEWLGATYRGKEWYEMSKMADCIPCMIVEG